MRDTSRFLMAVLGARLVWVTHRGDEPGNERGGGLVEYALLAALIAVVCIAAVGYFGSATSEKFDSVGSAVSST